MYSYTWKLMKKNNFFKETLKNNSEAQLKIWIARPCWANWELMVEMWIVTYVLLECFIEIIKKTQKSGCNCPVPCNRIEYEPSLSYAQLSQNNIESLIITSPTKKSQLETKFHTAKENKQRVVTSIANEDTTNYNNLITISNKIEQLINDNSAMMVAANFTTNLKILDFKTASFLKKDMNTIKQQGNLRITNIAMTSSKHIVVHVQVLILNSVTHIP